MNLRGMNNSKKLETSWEVRVKRVSKSLQASNNILREACEKATVALIKFSKTINISPTNIKA